MKSILVLQGLATIALAQTYSATYSPSDAPDTTEEGQTGTNKCGTGSSQTSTCQNAYRQFLFHLIQILVYSYHLRSSSELG